MRKHARYLNNKKTTKKNNRKKKMKKNIPKREYFQAMKNHEGKLQKETIQIKQKETQSNILIGAYINVFHI